MMPAPVQPSSNAPVKRSESAPTRASSSPVRGGSWLSDLLDRASREEAAPERKQPQRSTASAIESLDSISVDIARLIDHDTAIELWDRYRKGEKNIFTRRLYTLQGQQAFDDIRRRYQSDQEFRNVVDRYIEEFERLLSEVGANDRDLMVTKTYLTSETGKVYTMLAHAAGRFE